MSAPATLPKDFFDQAPQTLPADFQFEEVAAAPPVPKTEQAAGPWDRMLAHTRETLPKIAGALSRFGAPTGAPMTAIPQAKMSVAEGREAMSTPILKPSLALPQKQGGIPLEAARGVIEGIEGLSSAENAALLLGIGGAGAAAKTLGVAPKVFQAADTALSAYFTGAMGTGAYEAGKDAWGKVRNGDYPGAARSLGLGSVSSLFALLAGKHAVGKARAMLTGKTAVAEPNLTPQAKVPDVSVKVEPGLVEQVGQAASRTQLHGGGQDQKKRAKATGVAAKPQPVAGPIEPDWADVTGTAPEPTVKPAEPQGTLPTAKDAAQLKKQVKLVEAAQTAGVSYATGRPLNALTKKAQGQWLADAKKRAEPPPLPAEKPEKPKTATQVLREKQATAKALAAEKKTQDEAKAAELKAKIQGMPPAEVEKGIAEAVKALPDDQLREVAAAQELPKPPKEGEPEAPLPKLAEQAADELLSRQAPLEPFRIEQGSYEPIAPEGENVRFRFTNLKGNVHEDVMPRAKWDDLASKGDPVAPAEPVQPAPEVPPAPPALGSEPVAPGRVAAAGDVAGGGAKGSKAQWHVYVDDKLSFSTSDKVEAMDRAALAKKSGTARKVAVGQTKAGQQAPIDITPPLAAAFARNAKAVAERKDKLKGERGSFTAPVTPEDIKGVAEKAKRAGAEIGKFAVNLAHEAMPLSNVLTREGGIGKGLMNTIRESTDRGEVKAGVRIADIKEAGLDRLTREEQFNLHDALQGIAAPMNEKVSAVFDAARASLEGTGKEMESRGITAQEKVTVKPGEDVPAGYNLNSRQKLSLIAAERAGRSVTLSLERPAKARKNYFPQLMASIDALKSGHVRKDVADNIVRMGLRPDKAAAEAFIDRWVTFLESGKRDDVLIQHLVDTKQAKNAPEALAALMGMRDRAIGRQKMGSMEYARQVNLPFYDPIPGRVLPNWLLRSSVFLERAGALGQKNEAVKKAVYDIKKAGGNYADVADAARRILGAVREPQTGITEALREIRTFQGFKLALSAIPNATQPINILLKSDLSSFLSGIKGSMTKEGRKFGERSGAVLENVIQESLKNAGAEGEALNKFLKWNAFIPVEKNNRLLAANAGRAYAQRLANKLKLDPQSKSVRYRMEELGLRPDDILHRGELSPGDILMAAKKMSDITQFRARAEDLPGVFSTPWGKVIFQFKNFSYNQGRLVFDATVGEMRRGEYGAATKNLLVLATVFPLAGEAISDLRNAITGRENKKEGWDRYWGTITQSAALGLVGDLMQSGSWGKGASALLGPTGSDVADIIDLAGKKDVGREAAKLAFRRIPLIGPVFVNRFFPPKKPARRFAPLGKGF